jgi:hypothetical protein
MICVFPWNPQDSILELNSAVGRQTHRRSINSNIAYLTLPSSARQNRAKVQPEET